MPIETQAGIGLDAFLAKPGERSLLRFSTAGSVDDGKSTLIGRLLFDTRGAYDDQIEAVKKSRINRSHGALDLSLLTDGLQAEREQGITIDVAYRYFSTPRRKFIIADTPGHEQYTRNMATGASTVDAAVILIDARHGVVEQSRRHAYISGLLGIRHLVVAVNKMDLVDFREDRFAEIRAEFEALRPHLRGAELQFIPVCAVDGDNVARRSERMPWYGGPSLLEYLEELDVDAASARAPFRMAVQYVIRPHLDFRGLAGRIAGGRVAVGDEVTLLPAGRRSRVERIVTFDGDLAEAVAPMSVTLTLTDEVDVSRGAMVAAGEQGPAVSRWMEASLVWMHAQALVPGQAYLLRHGPHEVTARVAQVKSRMDVAHLRPEPNDHLGLNDIGLVVVETTQPLHFDPYRENRQTGSFILIDAITNETVAAGMIEAALADPAEALRQRKTRSFERGPVTAVERQQRYGQQPVAILLEPESASAVELERLLFNRGATVCRLRNGAPGLEALLAAGLLVITSAAPPEVPSLVAHADPQRTLVELRERGYLVEHDWMEGGEGI